MGCEWRRVQVSDVCELIVDCVNKTAPISPVPTAYKMIRTPNIKNGRVSTIGCRFVVKETFDKWTRRASVQVNDVLLTREAPLGEVGIVTTEENIFLGQRIMQYRADSSVLDPHFLLYSFLSPDLQHQFSMHEGSGSVVSHIRVGDCSKFEINLPPLKEQQKIVEILKNVDKKVALNRQINQTLEQMAQTLFKSWFVDFDPVIDNALDAIANGQNIEIPESLAKRFEARKAVRESEGFEPLPADIRQLFPCEFEESELGFVPKGWEIDSLSSIANYGKNRISVSELTLENYISTENMLTEKKGISSAAKLPTVNSVPAYSGGNVLISNIRPYFKKIWMARGDGGYSNDVLGFEAKDENTEAYLFNLLYQDSFFDYMMTTSKGSKMPRGDKKAIMDLKIVIPPVTLRMFYSQKVAEFYESSHLRQLENKSLIELRDTLLPKLISGELRLDSPQGEALQQAVSAE
ncbi:restriction endonuclease subunit S [Aliivibrio fischeri]|uniref:restriction endonuclease subunit S n=1 Tax=Aliivibrio fischeri TaxID=668 RepID=UPI0012DA4BF7|nr:restriction endonuclease subunit S [Aliivibrio fischeri]MUK93528.1 restriction endonuclease subunit S [Aliivibrio fischeri]